MSSSHSADSSSDQDPEWTAAGDTPSAALEMSSLLRQLAAGSVEARNQLWEFLYRELRRIAEVHMRGQPKEHTLQPSALVNEAWLKLASPEGVEVPSRRQFLALASKAMRSVLVDHARRKNADKRGGGMHQVALDRVVVAYESKSLDLEQLDEALQELETFNPEMAEYVDLRFFGSRSAPRDG